MQWAPVCSLHRFSVDLMHSATTKCNPVPKAHVQYHSHQLGTGIALVFLPLRESAQQVQSLTAARASGVCMAGGGAPEGGLAAWAPWLRQDCTGQCHCQPLWGPFSEGLCP